MTIVILLVLISEAVSQDDEPFSELDIFHTFDTGLEGALFINPPDDINSWMVHITLNQPMDRVEVSLFQRILPQLCRIPTHY